MKKHSGFTLIELMITLIIVSVLLTVGMPSLKTFMKSSQLVASTNELISAFHVARSEAIKLNSNVTICESSDGTSCTSPGTGNWESGWIVFVDSFTEVAVPPATGSTPGDLINTGEACSDDNTGTDCLLRSHAGFTDNQLTVAGVDAGGLDISSFTFNSRGLPRDAAGSLQSGTFSLCSGDTFNSRAVVLSLSGRVRVSDNAAVISCP